MQLYKDVVKNSEDDYDDERQTNVSAVTAALSLNNPNSDMVIYTDKTIAHQFDIGTYPLTCIIE